MHLKTLLPIALGAAVSAQSLTELLTAQNETLSLVTGLITAQPGLVEQLSGLKNITILAPSNAAIAAFTNSSASMSMGSDSVDIVSLLTYHVLNGTYPSTAFTEGIQFLPTLLSNASYANVTGGQVVGGKVNGSDVIIYSGLLQTSMVTQADLNFTGGVVHVIDKVLTIPASDSATAVAAGLTSLAGALTAANLVDTVDGLKDVTIFAPANSAFAGIGSLSGNITTEILTDILQYHVIQGTVAYSSTLSNETVETIGGGNVTISIIDGSVFVNSAKVLIPDVLVANGVVHVIDGVLNPSNSTATPNPSTTEAAFPGASTASDGSIPFTSGISAPTTATSAPTSSGEPGSGAGPSTASAAGAARAMQTGAIGVGALFGGAMIFAANM